MPAAPAPLQTSLVGLDVAAGEMERIDQAGGGDDGGAVLVVVEDRNVQQLAQALLDDEALGRLDVLEIDAAPALAEKPDAVDELVGILGRDLEIDGVDVGEALEQHRLAFHHRLGGERAAIAEAENGGAVGDDGDEVALGGVVVGEALVGGDRQDRHGDAGRIGERQVALGRHRLGGDDFELAGPALAVKLQCFLVREGRPLRPAAVICSHFNSLVKTYGNRAWGPANVSGSHGPCSRCRISAVKTRPRQKRRTRQALTRQPLNNALGRSNSCAAPRAHPAAQT